MIFVCQNKKKNNMCGSKILFDPKNKNYSYFVINVKDLTNKRMCDLCIKKEMEELDGVFINKGTNS